MFLHWRITFLLAVTLQVMNVAVFADNAPRHEWNVDQWMASYLNCENDRNNELYKEFTAFSREIINNLKKEKLRCKSEQMELKSQAAECRVSLHQLVQIYADAAAEWRKEKLELNLKMRNNEQELTQLQQEREKFLIAAAGDGSVELVTNLLNTSVNLNAVTTEDNTTALIHAANRNRTDICEILVNAGAGVNMQNSRGDSALSRAIFRDNLKAVKILVENGAEVNMIITTGNTPLHFATRYGIIDIVKILVDHGGNLSVKNNAGYTPLGNAKFYNQYQMVNYLTSIGAPE